jgi:hypothetical protein
MNQEQGFRTETPDRLGASRLAAQCSDAYGVRALRPGGDRHGAAERVADEDDSFRPGGSQECRSGESVRNAGLEIRGAAIIHRQRRDPFDLEGPREPLVDPTRRAAGPPPAPKIQTKIQTMPALPDEARCRRQRIAPSAAVSGRLSAGFWDIRRLVHGLSQNRPRPRVNRERPNMQLPGYTLVVTIEADDARAGRPIHPRLCGLHFATARPLELSKAEREREPMRTIPMTD